MEGLGINISWFLFQLGNFIVLGFGLYWLLHKPLIKLLDERRQEIAQSLEKAREVELQLASITDQRETLMSETRKQALEVMHTARQQAEEFREKLHAEAAVQTEHLRQQVEKQIQGERTQLLTELKKELAGIVVDATTKALAQEKNL